MDRKGIFAVTVAIITIVVWQINYSRQMQKYTDAKLAAEALVEKAKAKAKAEAPVPAETVVTAPAAGGAPGQTPVESAAPATPESLEKIPSPSVEYTFTNLGGGISRAVLLKHVAEHGGLQSGDRDTKVTLNEFGDTPIGAVAEKAGEETRVPFKATISAQTGEATFERTDARQLETVKKFTVPKTTDLRGEYLVDLDLTFTNKGPNPIQVGAYYVHTGSAGPIHALDLPTYTGVGWFNGGNNFKGATAFGASGILGFGHTEASVLGQQVDGEAWLGVTNQYFTTIVTPTNAKGSGMWARKLGVESLPATDPRALAAAEGKAKANLVAVEGAIGMPGFTLAPGATVTQKFEIYAGPRQYARLKTLGAEQDSIMNFGTFRWVSEALLNSLNWLHARVGSYAAAIIILTLIIRSAMWPLQNKSTESMKKMQVLTPEMNKLKEKYADDPTRMNQEMMKLYKEHGVNPLSGCLPMVVQIPIFFGLFRMLGIAVELRNSTFLWVHDLSQPDTVAVLLGKPINILPLCMAVTMFLQMKLSPKSGDAAQQKIFMFMPLIFVFFCYNYASALALYWTVQNLFSIGQLYVTRNKVTLNLKKITGAGRKKGRA